MQIKSKNGENMKNIILISVVFGLLAASSKVDAAEPRFIEFLKSPNAAANLPFSDAVRVGKQLYVSGKIGVLPGTRALVPGGIKEETRQAMENLKASVEMHGYAMKDLVKCTAILTDMSEFAAFNQAYTSFLKEPYPARTSMGAASLSLGARVEIECIAAKEN